MYTLTRRAIKAAPTTPTALEIVELDDSKSKSNNNNNNSDGESESDGNNIDIDTDNNNNRDTNNESLNGFRLAKINLSREKSVSKAHS